LEFFDTDWLPAKEGIFLMHISEGVLSAPVLISGAALAAVGTGIGLKRLEYDQIAKAGMLSAAFFVASLVHIPIGPSNAHLILNGLLGLLLGWGAFPAILVALVLQAVFFQFGGITTLGVNTVIMALPAVFCFLIFGRLVHKNSGTASIAAFACGFLSVLLSGLFVAVSLIFTDENFLEVSGIIIAAHIPVMIIEGIVTVICVVFLRKVKPEMLSGNLN
jgi:cobalt/nickel transport system permease protein